ncbi:phage portal protein, partial [Salmonella enterica]|nr:phage portal protein [Salmonella enterica]
RKWERIPAYGKKTGRRNVLHVMQDWERPGQRRGVPVLAPVIEALKQLGRYTDAELVAAVVSGLFTVFVKTEAPEGPIGEAG